jgi:hypothetical protein
LGGTFLLEFTHGGDELTHEISLNSVISYKRPTSSYRFAISNDAAPVSSSSKKISVARANEISMRQSIRGMWSKAALAIGVLLTVAWLCFLGYEVARLIVAAI